MNATASPIARFIATDGVANCYGANHSDHGRIGMCSNCGAIVCQNSETKRLYDMRQRVKASGNPGYDFACWNGTHQCDPVMVDMVSRERAEKIAAGELVLGAPVEVVRGRKVPKGTRGILAWSGSALDYNGKAFRKAGVKTDDGRMHFVPETYLRSTVND